MSDTKFKFMAVSGYRREIVKVECVSETAKMVTIKVKDTWRKGQFCERKCLKVSAHDCYFDTWAEAHELLLSRAESKFESTRRNMERAQDELGNIKGMKPPKDAP